MCYKLLARKPRQDKKTQINDNNSEHQPEKTKIKTIIQSTGRKRQELKTVIQSTGHQILKLVTPIRTGACKRRGERGARQDGRCVCVYWGEASLQGVRRYIFVRDDMDIGSREERARTLRAVYRNARASV